MPAQLVESSGDGFPQLTQRYGWERRFPRRATRVAGQPGHAIRASAAALTLSKNAPVQGRERSLGTSGLSRPTSTRLGRKIATVATAVLMIAGAYRHRRQEKQFLPDG